MTDEISRSVRLRRRARRRGRERRTVGARSGRRVHRRRPSTSSRLFNSPAKRCPSTRAVSRRGGGERAGLTRELNLALRQPVPGVVVAEVWAMRRQARASAVLLPSASFALKASAPSGEPVHRRCNPRTKSSPRSISRSGDAGTEGRGQRGLGDLYEADLPRRPANVAATMRRDGSRVRGSGRSLPVVAAAAAALHSAAVQRQGDLSAKLV